MSCCAFDAKNYIFKQIKKKKQKITKQQDRQ